MTQLVYAGPGRKPRKPRPIRVRGSAGRLYVILEVPPMTSDDSTGEPRYELPNRAPVSRISETEFLVVQTGQILTHVA